MVVKGAQKKMLRVNVPLDPTRTGRDAEALEGSLRRMIVGQDEAIQQIVNIYQMNLTGMTPSGRPIGNFLFLGPTGSGKTRIVEATAEALVRNPRAVIKIDCAEFQHSHEIAKLIGSPPGYLGHRETHPLLSQEVLNQYHTDTCKLSFVLFDEIEKASDALWNLLLGILDKGTLTLGDNRKVDFSRALIFMTSNLGATEMSALMNPKLGFNARRMRPAIPKRNRGRKTQRQDDAQRRWKRRGASSRPSSSTVWTRSSPSSRWAPTSCRKILDIELNLVQQRIFNTSPENDRSSSRPPMTRKDFLLKEGTDLKYGARHLKRAIERLLVQPMSNLIATDQVRGGDCVNVDFDSDACALSLRQGSRRAGRSRHGGSGGSLHLHPSLCSGQRRLHRSRQDSERPLFETSLKKPA